MFEGWGWLVGTIAIEAGVFLIVFGTVAIDSRRTLHGANTPARRAAARRAVRTALVSTALLVLAVGAVIAAPAVEGAMGPDAAPPLPGFVLATFPLIGLIALLLAESWSAARWPRAQGARREARLSERTITEVLRARQRTVWPWFVVLALTCLALGLSSSGPRAISRVVQQYEAYTTAPYPGWLWTVPIFVLSLVAAATLELTLRAISTRARADGVDEAWDMWLRRRTARRLVRVTRLVVGMTTASLLYFASMGVSIVGRGHGNNQAGPGDTSLLYVTVAQALTLIGAGIALASLAQVVLPSRDLAPEPALERVGADV